MFEAYDCLIHKQSLRAEAILNSLVQQRTHPIYLLLKGDIVWSPSQEDVALRFESRYVQVSVERLVEIATARVNHKQKKRRKMRTTIKDLKLFPMMIFLGDIQFEFEKSLNAYMTLDYEDGDSS